jgi:conjugal transfer mating pair stabilization protein TraG
MGQYLEILLMTLPIAVYGNADLYRELFNAIAAALGDSAFGHLTRLALALTGTWAIVRYSVERSLMPLVRWLLMYYVAFYIAFFPKITIEILDQTESGKAYSVDHVPLGLAVIASYTSAIGAGLTHLMEKNFSLPDSLTYQKTGLAMASRMVLASTQFQVTDPHFAQSLHSFVQQCVFYDVLLHKYSWNDLLYSTHIWQWVSQHASPARSFLYYRSGTPEILTCQAGVSILTYDWQDAVQKAAARYGAWTFPQEKAAKAALLSHLESSYHFLTNIADNAATLMQQAMMANAIQEGQAQMSASNNAPAALEAYAFIKAQQQKRLTNTTIGDMAAYWLPIMKNVLEATLYGAFIFVFLLLLFPFGPSILKNYVASLLWIQCWAPLYAILNLFINFYAQHHNVGAIQLGNGESGFTLATQAGLAQVNADIAGLAGYLSLSVPLLAAGIAKGMMSVFSQAAQYIGGVTQSVASSSAGEAITGNISLGNTQFSNHSSFNTSANHFDTNTRVFSGMYSTQMAGGSMLSITPDGSSIMNNQSATSNLGTSINLAHAIRTMAGQQADQAYSTALSAAHAYSDSVSSGLRSLYEFGSHLSISQASGTGASVSVAQGTSTAINKTHQLIEKFAHAHNISDVTAIKHLGAAYISVQAGGGISASTPSILPTRAMASGNLGGGARSEVDNLHSHDKGDLYSAAHDFIQSTQFSENVDKAVRGVQEHHYRASDEQGQRLLESVGSSFDAAHHARHEMMANYQQSQSYREMASRTEENATSINSNASQAFMQWLQQQPELQHPGDIEKMMTHDPVRGQAYAERFTQERASQALHAYHPGVGSSPEEIKTTFKKEQSAVPGDEQILQAKASHQSEITHASIDKGLDPHHRVSRQVDNEVTTFIHDSEKEITDAKTNIIQGSKKEREEVEKRWDKD